MGVSAGEAEDEEPGEEVMRLRGYEGGKGECPGRSGKVRSAERRQRKQNSASATSCSVWEVQGLTSDSAH